ncbi:D-alanine--D-alanine ligase family protein [Thiohalobacter thiocyanaticus]|uniref:D-alanine--D-alanine ligase n=1 Tax=Thiohalobacter thiocyanaticus TaxID=585455 RepID=A0A426QLX1_9GAMM|nr:D-alanine--D-alanine ligase [Thiohalobacter thiocyanaticus]RRQ22745.1 D-alanine--D-alanine ligase [Thiohalobacter thiocyanaticus]
MAGSKLTVGVLLGDQQLPYSFSPEGRLGQEEIRAFQQLEAALAQLTGYRFRYFNDHERLIDDLRGANLDLALNFCDTGYRNDWNLVTHIPSLLEMLDIPYTGSNGMTLNVTADKSLVRALAVTLNIPVPNEVYVDLRTDPLPLPEIYPALIKPNQGAGSFGMSRDCVVHDASQAVAYMTKLAGMLEPPEAVIQDFLTGPEYTVGIVGNPATGLVPLPPAEIDYSDLEPGLPPVFTYDAKFDAASPYWNQLRHRRAELEEVTHARLIEYCSCLYRRLGIRDYARFDFRCGTDGQPRLLDANPNPTWYADSRMSMMAGWAGYSYTELLRLILQAAIERYALE